MIGRKRKVSAVRQPFLDHLEDLRWTVMKVVVAVVMGVLSRYRITLHRHSLPAEKRPTNQAGEFQPG